MSAPGDPAGVDAALRRLGASQGRQYWRSLEELFETAEFRRRIVAEFPALARMPTAIDRRSFFQCLAAAVALAGLDGCERRADEDAYPLVLADRDSQPGMVRHYATAWELDGVGQPVVGTCRDGRPIKLEGNPDHPASGGKTDAFTQAALLGLYDPARSGGPLRDGAPATWDGFGAVALAARERFDASGGTGFALLTGPVQSPTLLRQIAGMRSRWPGMAWHVHAPLAEGPATLDGMPPLDAIDVLVCLDADPLGNGPLQTWHAQGWSARRRAFQQGDGAARLLAAEPTPTLTGVTAEARLIAPHSRIGMLAMALGARLGVAEGASQPLDAKERAWIEQATDALQASRGRGLLCVGPQHGPELQMLGSRINATLGNQARAPRSQPQPSGDLAALHRAIGQGGVHTLLILDSNPCYASPDAAGLAAALKRVPLTIHAGLHQDETGQACRWHLPLAHLLESWSDVRCADDSAGLVQPLVRPFLDVRTRHQVLALLTDGELPARDLVRQTWPGDEVQWQSRLLKGFVAEAPMPAELPAPAAAPPPAAPPPAAMPPRAPSPAGDALEVVFRPDPTVHDGAFASNPWLQEMPKPLTKLTWDNAVHIAPALAEELGIANEDLVEVSAAGRSIVGPAWIVPGQHARTVLLHLGYGRCAGGPVALGSGFDAYPLRSPSSPWARGDGKLRKLSGTRALACTQTHWALGGHDWIRTVEAPGEALPRKEEQKSFFPPQPKEKPENGASPPPAWGMAIDLDLCIGCNACAVACVAENNVPMVGREQVAKGREMHWLRIDRYYDGTPDEPRQSFQPVPCMHCEDAPCETGCPVNATVHSPDGLNLQVYNRCIGTRTCSAYCPYKVRRFNWLDYTREAAPALVAQRNPDVTVRDRGVMEKCTYCIQRIAEARIAADKEGRPIADGEVVTACQQACPTQAIVFGDLTQADSAVAKRKASGRDYALLEDANTRPRTTYGAKIEGGGSESAG